MFNILVFGKNSAVQKAEIITLKEEQGNVVNWTNIYEKNIKQEVDDERFSKTN